MVALVKLHAGASESPAANLESLSCLKRKSRSAAMRGSVSLVSPCRIYDGSSCSLDSTRLAWNASRSASAPSFRSVVPLRSTCMILGWDFSACASALDEVSPILLLKERSRSCSPALLCRPSTRCLMPSSSMWLLLNSSVRSNVDPVSKRLIAGIIAEPGYSSLLSSRRTLRLASCAAASTTAARPTSCIQFPPTSITLSEGMCAIARERAAAPLCEKLFHRKSSTSSRDARAREASKAAKPSRPSAAHVRFSVLTRPPSLASASARREARCGPSALYERSMCSHHCGTDARAREPGPSCSSAAPHRIAAPARRRTDRPGTKAHT
eukprot:scaffold72669_cov35-Tisochrysis_lutea.AAC.2